MSGSHDGHEEHESSPYARRIRAIETLLVEKGVLTREDVRRQIEYMEARSPANGAKLVARAWVDPEFKARLLSDTKAAAKELGIDASGPVEFVVELPDGIEVVVHDSTADVRYMVLPMRQPGTEGMGEEELAALVTRDSLIGVSVPRSVARVGDRGSRE